MLEARAIHELSRALLHTRRKDGEKMKEREKETEGGKTRRNPRDARGKAVVGERAKTWKRTMTRDAGAAFTEYRWGRVRN